MLLKRNLDYIINDELHNYLEEKFITAQKNGINIEIELTEPIDDIYFHFKDISRILNIALNDAFKVVTESKYLHMAFCMFYKANELHFIIKYKSKQNIAISEVNKRLIKKLCKYRNIYCNAIKEDSYITQQLILINENNS